MDRETDRDRKSERATGREVRDRWRQTKGRRRGKGIEGRTVREGDRWRGEREKGHKRRERGGREM